MQQLLMPVRRGCNTAAEVQGWVQQAGGVVAAAAHEAAAAAQAHAHTQRPAEDGETQEHALPAQSRCGIHSHCAREWRMFEQVQGRRLLLGPVCKLGREPASEAAPRSSTPARQAG